MMIIYRWFGDATTETPGICFWYITTIRVLAFALMFIEV